MDYLWPQLIRESRLTENWRQPLQTDIKKEISDNDQKRIHRNHGCKDGLKQS
jgi:hypothetical protein